MMLELIAKALTDYNEKGIAVITSTEYDPLEVAEYVRLVLDGLKCSYKDWYNSVEHSFFFEDAMSEL